MRGMIRAGAQRAVAAAERVDEILATAPVIGDHAGGRPLPDAGPDGHRGEVRFRDVRFSYAPDLPVVLDGFDLSVRAGESVALVGATGSGKTTVARLIPRFYDVLAGCAAVEDASHAGGARVSRC